MLASRDSCLAHLQGVLVGGRHVWRWRVAERRRPQSPGIVGVKNGLYQVHRVGVRCVALILEDTARAGCHKRPGVGNIGYRSRVASPQARVHQPATNPARK